jgi:ferric-dicitrate binding protein FerR (iron transport regulator)
VSGGDRRTDETRVRELLMRALDGELDDQERRELEALRDADPTVAREWRELARLKEVTDTMKLRNPPEELWAGYWNSVYSRLERGLGWILLSVGAIILGGWGVWTGVQDMIGDPTLPPLVKGGILALGFGLVILLVSVARHRFLVRRTDPYRDVEL